MSRRFKTHIKYEETNYQVNNTKGIVTCKMRMSIPVCTLPGFNFILYNSNVVDRFIKALTSAKLINKTSDFNICFDENDNPCKLFFSIYTVARCGSNDTFDVETGKRIALTRAQRNAFNVGKIVYGCVSDTFVSDFEMYYQSLSNHSRLAANHAKDHIKTLY